MCNSNNSSLLIYRNEGRSLTNIVFTMCIHVIYLYINIRIWTIITAMAYIYTCIYHDYFGYGCCCRQQIQRKRTHECTYHWAAIYIYVCLVVFHFCLLCSSFRNPSLIQPINKCANGIQNNRQNRKKTNKQIGELI